MNSNPGKSLKVYYNPKYDWVGVLMTYTDPIYGQIIMVDDLYSLPFSKKLWIKIGDL